MPAPRRRNERGQSLWVQPAPVYDLAAAIPAWTELARCTEVDPETFFPESGRGSTQPAKTICFSCEARTECLEWALDNGEDFGVFGGKDPRERRKILRDAAKQ